MLQFYFLSILLNAIIGYMLVYADRESLDIVPDARVPAIVHDETFRLVLGILTAVTGFFKLLTPVRGDIPVIGDLFPALTGLAGGFAVLYEYYKTRTTVDEEALPPFVRKIIDGKRYVGVACLMAAAFHFLFPTIPFL
ncbi:MAG TPA: hypothetical protein PKO22_08490 [Treponemataceae bacterium]|nr:hypothetical protein [Treponemataceae bacterium]